MLELGPSTCARRRSADYFLCSEMASEQTYIMIKPDGVQRGTFLSLSSPSP